jgi:L-rhamnose mutarotase
MSQFFRWIAPLAVAVLAGCATCPGQCPREKVERYGSVIQVRPEKLAEYKELHANCWPEVLDMIRKCNIRNYSIYYRDGILYSYFEYVGDDFKADMAKMAADPKTQEWWARTDPCQIPVESAKEGEKWAPMEEVFHSD